MHETAHPPHELSRYIQVFDGALSAETCARMVDSFELLKRFHVLNGATRRQELAQSAWTELDLGPLSDQAFRSMLLGNMLEYLERYNQALSLTIKVPSTHKTSEWIVKRYRPGGERFQPHFDSVGPVANRYLVFLWYLNEVSEGGETAFVDLNLSVAPKAGRLLIFPPYWMFQHEGRAPLSGDKYILSSYLLF
jgi:hypothetical protein